MQPFPHPSDATHKIWSRLANWLQRYSSLKVWTTDNGPLVYYKLTLWAFGSGELTKWHVHPVKTQNSLGFRPVWSESSLSTWRKLGSLATHWAHSEDSDQTGRMPRLIWVFTRCTVFDWFCHEVAYMGIWNRSLKPDQNDWAAYPLIYMSEKNGFGKQYINLHFVPLGNLRFHLNMAFCILQLNIWRPTCP